MLTEDEANALPRTPAKEVLDFVVKECDAIADKLPVDYSKLGDDAAANETGRVGKLAVLALKARTLLYEASPLFNTNDDKELYHQAALASKLLSMLVWQMVCSSVSIQTCGVPTTGRQRSSSTLSVWVL